MIAEYIELIKQTIKMRVAIHYADMQQRAYNKRYFVVLITVGFDKSGRPINKLRTINNRDFKAMKRKGWLPKTMSYLELSERAFYSTSVSANNKESAEARKEAQERFRQYRASLSI